MIDVKLLKQLREETGVSYTLCKKALEEAKGDIKKAKQILYKAGAERVTQKLTQIVNEGAIFSYVHHNKKVASLVELFCQTDFVARNKEFQYLGQELAMQVASLSPQNVDELMQQEYIREPEKKIDHLIKEFILKLGENIKVGRILRWGLGINK